MGIFMDSIDFNECLKKKKNWKKKLSLLHRKRCGKKRWKKKKERNKQSLFLDGREFCIL